MPRRNRNADERVDKKWSEDFIRQLMKKLQGEKRDNRHDRAEQRKD